MKDGHALCVNCGKEPEQKSTKIEIKEEKSNSTLKILEEKLEKLSIQLESENEPAKQQETDKIHRFTSKCYSKIKVKLKKFLSLPFCFNIRYG